MSNNLDEDLRGLLRALIALVAGFDAVLLLLGVLGPEAVEHLVS
ncbi:MULTISPECIES: hypothetical protein [Halorussus]|nr:MULTISPECIES: hypothetical protein [Halorussus]